MEKVTIPTPQIDQHLSTLTHAALTMLERRIQRGAPIGDVESMLAELLRDIGLTNADAHERPVLHAAAYLAAARALGDVLDLEVLPSDAR